MLIQLSIDQDIFKNELLIGIRLEKKLVPSWEYGLHLNAIKLPLTQREMNFFLDNSIFECLTVLQYNF